jgi:3-oxoacyl-[acyl-carrier protein] reductase
MGDPVECARGAVFLASELASYVTGHVLSVDGGLLMR